MAKAFKVKVTSSNVSKALAKISTPALQMPVPSRKHVVMLGPRRVEQIGRSRTVQVYAEGLTEMILFLIAKQEQIERGAPVEVLVGYGTDYAIYQHENMRYKHTHPQSARFLTTPARALNSQYGPLVRDVMLKGGTFADAILRCAYEIGRFSQILVPVDSGLLKSTLTIRRTK